MTLLTPVQPAQPTANDGQPEPSYYQPENQPPKKAKRRRWILPVISLIILAIILSPIISGSVIIVKGISLSQRIEKITSAAASNDWPSVQGELADASGDLAVISKSLGYLGPVFWFPPLSQSVRVSKKMSLAASEMLSGYSETLAILERLQLTTGDAGQLISQLGEPEKKKSFLRAIAESEAELKDARSKIRQAKQTINSINEEDFSGVFKDRLLELNHNLVELVDNSEIALPILENLPELVGLNQSKTYLFVFQNNMELRPTGGFIGSYGILTFKDGEISDLLTDDVYNLDKLSIGKLDVLPPEPLQKYMGQKNWFLRDANWYTDWPTSAQNIIWFFDRERENAALPYQRLDGVIALTPDFIANLLKVVGPVTVEGVTFTDANFAMELEKEVERNYIEKGIPKERRKSIIGPLTRELISRIENADLPDMLQSWLAFKKNIEEKHILVYLTEPQLQQYFSDQNWSGVLKDSESDYLLAIDANMAAWKTDSVMKKSIDYRLAEVNGGLVARTALTYEHQSERVPYFIREYRDYLQLYVPEGSQLLSAYWSDQSGRHQIDLNSQLEIKKNFGKTVFAYFFTVEPKSTRTIVFEYELPDSVWQQYRQGTYKLLAQKQPGTVGHDLKVDLKFNRSPRSYHSEIMPERAAGKQLIWQTNLNIDREFKADF